jgi:hypothetical protein
MGAVGNNGGRANGAESWPDDAPGQAALIPGTSKVPGFSLSREAALDDAMVVPGSFDIVDLGIGELGLLGYPHAPLLSRS